MGVKTQKPDFSEILYIEQVCWGMGNDLVGLPLIASFKFSEPSEDEEKKERAEYEQAKEIYDKHINRNAKFTAIGKGANANIICRITSINSKNHYVTWKQCNLSQKEKEAGIKPAKGKWGINAMIYMVKSGQILFS